MTDALLGTEANADASILTGCVKESVFCEKNGPISRRTGARYRNQPDGLPYIMWGGEVWIPIYEGREWLKRRIRRPNPRRK
jgi:hypothetical protein